MNILYVEGDLLTSSEPVIAHGCNAQGKMKSGVAKAIRAKYPTAYRDYRKTFKSQLDKLHLGQVIVSPAPGRIILNLITQEFYGRDPSVVYVSYDAIEQAVHRINELGYTRVAFPKIGAGLANGNWEKIASIIETHSEFEPVVYYLPQ